MDHDIAIKLLLRLHRGDFFTAEQLKSIYQLTTAALHKVISRLKEMGTEIICENQGYRLQHPFSLFQEDKIKQYLPEQLKEHVQVNALFSTDSTNTQAPLLADNRYELSLCVADHQTAGRGRQANRWESPPGRNCYSSLLWYTDLQVAALDGLSLIAGLAIVKVLTKFGANDLKLKWPNDVFWQQKKLAGILVEIDLCKQKKTQIVIGAGVNLYLPEMVKQKIKQPVTDVYSILRLLPDKNQLVACFTAQMAKYLKTFYQFGFLPFYRLWNKYNLYASQHVILYSGNYYHEGLCVGVSQQGNLLIKKTDGIHAFSGGEISLKKKIAV